MQIENKKQRTKRSNHEMVGTKEYWAWCSMKVRCSNPLPKYRSWRGKGVKVCDRWINSFENFFNDMGFALSTKHTLDRINNAGNYEPGNCRWATPKVQGNNTDRVKHLTINGERKTISEWADHFGISYKCFWQRIKKGKIKNLPLDRPNKRTHPKRKILGEEEYKRIERERIKSYYEKNPEKRKEHWNKWKMRMQLQK